jgi:hypothetical protein
MIERHSRKWYGHPVGLTFDGSRRVRERRAMGVRTICLSSLLAGIAGLLQAAPPPSAARAMTSEMRFEVAQAPVDENNQAGPRKIRSYTPLEERQVGSAVEENHKGGARKTATTHKRRKSRSMATKDRQKSR